MVLLGGFLPYLHAVAVCLLKSVALLGALAACDYATVWEHILNKETVKKGKKERCQANMWWNMWLLPFSSALPREKYHCVTAKKWKEARN